MLDITTTNLANFGTELEYSIKRVAAEGEPCFKNFVNFGSESLRSKYVWRVKAFKLEEVSTQSPDFYRGDSYLALFLSDPSHSLSGSIFYWIGSSTTADEAGTAAYKAYELDTIITSRGGSARQYREACNNESEQFLAIFPGMRILTGGYDSGFRKVSGKFRKESSEYTDGTTDGTTDGNSSKDESLSDGSNKDDTTEGRSHCNRLLRVYRDHLVEVPYEWQSLDTYGVYILDAGTILYQWTGYRCPLSLRAPAMAAVRELDDIRGINSQVIVISEIEMSMLKDPLSSSKTYDLDGFARVLGCELFTLINSTKNRANDRSIDSSVEGSDEMPSMLTDQSNRSIDTGRKIKYVSSGDKNHMTFKWDGSKFEEVQKHDASGSIFIVDYEYACTVFTPRDKLQQAALCCFAYFNWARHDPCSTNFVVL